MMDVEDGDMFRNKNGNVIYITFNENGNVEVTPDALGWLLEQAGFESL